MQYWLVERINGSGEKRVKYLYFCSAASRETAKSMASSFLLGDPEKYTITPVTNPGEVVRLRINIESSSQ